MLFFFIVILSVIIAESSEVVCKYGRTDRFKLCSDRAKAKAKTYLTVAVYSLISLLFFVCSFIFLVFAPAFAYVNNTKNCNKHIGDKQ